MNVKKSKELLIESGRQIFNILVTNDLENYKRELNRFEAYGKMLEQSDIKAQIRIDGFVQTNTLRIKIIWNDEAIAEFR